MTRLELLEPLVVVHGLEDGPVTLIDALFYGKDLMLVVYRDASGAEGRQFLDRAAEGTIQAEPPSWRASLDESYRRYPTRVPRLFRDMSELAPMLARTRAQRRLHAVAEAYIGHLAARLTNPMVTVREIHAVVGARNDGLSIVPGQEVLWEVFGTVDRVDEDLRKLELDATPGRLKVAIVLDAEVDAKLFEKFVRKVQGSPVTTWFRLSDLMLQGRFERTVQALERKLDGLLSTDWPDQLRLVEFDLLPGHHLWQPVAELPFGFNGLHGHEFGGPLEDPTFFLDLQNIGTREARIYAAYVNVRFRQIKFHGVAEGKLLSPACTIALPLDGGEEGYREVRLDSPVLVPSGQHVRVLVRLERAGYCWRGEVEIGLRYGPQRALRVPALSIFR